MINSIRCPTDNGGCGKNDNWRVALDHKSSRIILDCSSCNYRHSFPLDVGKLTLCFTGPVDEAGAVVRS